MATKTSGTNPPNVIEHLSVYYSVASDSPSHGSVEVMDPWILSRKIFIEIYLSEATLIKNRRTILIDRHPESASYSLSLVV